MADDKTRDADSAPGAIARESSDVQEAQNSDQEALHAEAHRAGVEAVALALGQPA